MPDRKLPPRLVAAHLDRGLMRQNPARYDDALARCDAAIALDPSSADAYISRGQVLENLRRPAEALADYEKAAALDPMDGIACFNQGNALLALGRFEEAIIRYDRAISLAPHHANTRLNRGSTLLRLHRYGEALDDFERASDLRPGYADAAYNQGIALMRLDCHGEAILRFDQAIALQPHHADAWTNRGRALRALRRNDEALASYDRAISVDEDNPVARFNKAELLLALGEFAKGWPLYEWRWELDDARHLRRGFPQPLWTGSEAIAGKALLLHAEQGLGDTLQFCRYAPVLVERGADVVLEAPRSLVRLLSSLSNRVTLVARGDSLPAFDLHCPLMSVPDRVGTTTIPAQVPYLAAEPARVAHCRARLPADGLRIGIVWEGNPAGDPGRSVPLAEFAPLARVSGVHLVSLQRDHGLDQLRHLPVGMSVATLGPDFDAGPSAFLDAAATMMNLDLVISTDTAIAHLAGALARPVWVALKAVPHWTWMIDREESPWYPSARLFHQTTDGHWRAVFEQMAGELTSLERR